MELDDVGNGQLAPRILEGIIDVEDYLLEQPHERSRLGVPADYSSCAPPWIDTPVLRLRIPTQRPLPVGDSVTLSMPLPIIPTPSPSPPSLPVLRRIYTLRPENEEVTQRTTPRHLTIEGRHDPASGQVALFNFPALRDAAPPTREPEEEEGLTERQLHDLLQERRNLQRAARQARSEISALEPEARRLRNLLERQDQQLAEQLEALTLEARRPNFGQRQQLREENNNQAVAPVTTAAAATTTAPETWIQPEEGRDVWYFGQPPVRCLGRVLTSRPSSESSDEEGEPWFLQRQRRMASETPLTTRTITTSTVTIGDSRIVTRDSASFCTCTRIYGSSG